MNNINASPLEHLATNAITFVAGALVSLGLSAFSVATKQLIHQLIKRAGLTLVGQMVTKTLVTTLLKKVVGRTVVKQVLNFIQLAGWATNDGIKLTAMKYVGNSHVDDCYAICRRYLEQTASEES